MYKQKTAEPLPAIMNVRYFDTHCHLQFGHYSLDSSALIVRMQEEGVAGIVVGIDYASSQKAIELAERYEHLFASVGLHPNCIENDESLTLFDGRMEELARSPKAVAIGECGLDYFHPAVLNDEIKGAQRSALRACIALAVKLDKPLIIHCRPSKGTLDAYNDLIKILKEAKTNHQNLRGNIHFFVGGISEAAEFVALGFTLSFAAVITFARDYDAVIKALPLESILSETDSPYSAPAGRRGERNDPLAVIEVVNQIAIIRREDCELVRKTLLANARRLFALK